MAAKGGYSAQELGWLMGGSAECCALPPLFWEVSNGSPSGRTALVAKGFDPGEVEVVVKIPRGRPHEPSVNLLIRKQSAIRLDINGTHGGGRLLYQNETHWHNRRSSDQAEDFKLCEDAPKLPMRADVPPWSYREIYFWFFDHHRIDRSAILWEDPPGGDDR